MEYTTELSGSEFSQNIGEKCEKRKVRRDGTTKTGKTFKSGLKINTIKSVIEHPILYIPAYTFIEDDSYVECCRCYIQSP